MAVIQRTGLEGDGYVFAVLALLLLYDPASGINVSKLLFSSSVNGGEQ